MNKIWLFGFTLAALLACGGGGGGGSNATSPTTFDGEGAWVGTIHSNTYNVTLNATALILKTGQMSMAATNGETTVGTISGSGNSFSANGTVYASQANQLPNGVMTETITYAGTGTAGGSFSGTYSAPADNGTVTFTWDANANYQTPVVLVNLAGTYQCAASSNGLSANATLNSDGSFSGSDAQGSLIGYLTVVDASKNGFRVNITYTPSGQSSFTLAGLAYFDFTNPLSLNLAAVGSQGVYSGVFTQTASSSQPSITSANKARFHEGTFGTFTVTATGTPTPVLAQNGTLPSGVTFNPSTGVLSGIPIAGSHGTYPMTFTASNGTMPDATQNFSLVIAPPVGSIVEFPIPSTNTEPYGITSGTDGNLWFTEYGDCKIGKVTPTGTFTEFSLGVSVATVPFGITSGPDGNLWYVEPNGPAIGRITHTGTIDGFSTGLSASSEPYDITAGPDGNLWFTEYSGNKIGRITPTGTITEFSTGLTAGSVPFGITAGPDGNLWFTETNGRIGRITPTGTITEFSTGLTAGSRPFGITAGLDGNLWFTENNANQIGRITPTGTITEFSTGLTAGSRPFGITADLDGNLWFTENNANKIGRITPTGTITEFSTGLTAGSAPEGITTGPDGNLWFTEFIGNRIGLIVP
jgi:streptogramin lyase